MPGYGRLTERRAEFLHAWRGYERYARGHDDLRPLSLTIREKIERFRPAAGARTPPDGVPAYVVRRVS